MTSSNEADSSELEKQRASKWSLGERIASKLSGKQFAWLIFAVIVAYTAIEITKLLKEGD
jgi:NOL1/NOP2/fmu family ribosome biogenesis protein